MEFLRNDDPYAKTIVFCEDTEHADRMRHALVNASGSLGADERRYIMRITGDDPIGKAELDNFIDPESTYPVVVTTSQLMTTGVDAQTCKLMNSLPTQISTAIPCRFTNPRSMIPLPHQMILLALMKAMINLTPKQLPVSSPKIPTANAKNSMSRMSMSVSLPNAANTTDATANSSPNPSATTPQNHPHRIHPPRHLSKTMAGSRTARSHP